MLEKERQINENIQMNMYRDRVNGIISIEQYNIMNKKIIEEYMALEKKIQEVGYRKDFLIDSEKKSKRISEFLELTKLNRNFLLLLIRKVKVFKEKKVEITFNFKNPI